MSRWLQAPDTMILNQHELVVPSLVQGPWIAGYALVQSLLLLSSSYYYFVLLIKTKRFPPPSFITPGPGAYNVTQPVVNPLVMLQPTSNVVEVNTADQLLLLNLFIISFSIQHQHHHIVVSHMQDNLQLLQYPYQARVMVMKKLIMEDLYHKLHLTETAQLDQLIIILTM